MGGNGSAFAPTIHPEGYNERRVRQTVSDIVQRHIDSDIEHGYSLNLDGTIRSANNIGTEAQVEIQNAIDAITIHNHPAENATFSPQDIFGLAGEANGYMTIAYDRQMMYILRRIDWKQGGSARYSLFGDEKDYREFAADYQKAMDRADETAKTRIRERIQRGEITSREQCIAEGYRESNNICRNWLRNHAQEYGYEYLEKRIK